MERETEYKTQVIMQTHFPIGKFAENWHSLSHMKILDKVWESGGFIRILTSFFLFIISPINLA